MSQIEDIEDNNYDAITTNDFSHTRKVLVIAYYFPPIGLSGVQRTLKFTKYLSEFN
jgi:hypothetical protein